jgi:hypothetical protein
LGFVGVGVRVDGVVWPSEGSSTPRPRPHPPPPRRAAPRPTLTPRMTTQLLSLTPSPMTQPSPMDTSGPILQPLPILAVGCDSTLPLKDAPAASSLGEVARRLARWRFRPGGGGVGAGAKAVGRRVGG